jgi:hypothetical protein
MTELKQKYFTEKREFYLEAERIRAISKDSNGEVEFFIPYEDLTTRTRQITRQDGWIYTSAISFGIFSAVGLAAHAFGVSSMMRWVPLWIVATFVFLCFHLARRRKYTLVDLSDGKSVFFLRDKPSKEIMDAYFSKMFSARRSYLRRAYFKIDPENDPHRENARLQWLLAEGAIDEAEYRGLKMQLKHAEAEGDFDERGGNTSRIN